MGISSILHLHGDFNIPNDDVVNKGKMMKKRDTTSLEKIIEEKPQIVEPLNFQKLISEADHDYLTALPFITTEDLRGQEDTEGSIPRGEINQTAAQSPTVLSPSGRQMILVQHFEMVDNSKNDINIQNQLHP